LSAPPVSKQEFLRLELRERLSAEALLQRRFDVVDDRRVDGVDRRERLLQRDAWFEASEQIDPVVVSAIEPAEAWVEQRAHRDRHVDERTRGERGAIEILRTTPMIVLAVR
jgi:hypothetical protein